MATVQGIWVFNETVTRPSNTTWNYYVNFSSVYYGNTYSYTGFRYELEFEVFMTPFICYIRGNNNYDGVYDFSASNWFSEGEPRTVDFGETPQEVDQDFYTWLTANATQGGGSVFYNITYNLSNCYSNSYINTIEEGSNVSLNFIPNNEYMLPANISVTGADIISWNNFTGDLTIGNATSDVVVTIYATPKEMYDGVDNNTSIPIQSTTVFNSHIKLDISGVGQLAQTIISPPVLPSLFTKPNDWISALRFYPFDIVPLSDDSHKLTIGGIDTDIDCYDVNTGAVYFNMGEFLYKPYFNNFADYNGYTKIKIQLPYFGEVELFPNDVLNKYIQFRLKIDYNSGQGMWFIGVSNTSIPYATIDGKPIANDSGYDIRIISQNLFKIGIDIPLGTTNTAEVYRNIAMGVVRGVSVAAGAYVVSAMGATGGTSTTKTITTARNQNTGRQIRTGTETRVSTYDGSNYQKGRAINACFDVATDSLNSMHLDANADKPNDALMLNNLSKSIIITRYVPKFVEQTEEYGKLFGYPVGTTYKLSTIHGYTEVANIHFEGSVFNSATSKEMAMIEQAFADGVILP